MIQGSAQGFRPDWRRAALAQRSEPGSARGPFCARRGLSGLFVSPCAGARAAIFASSIAALRPPFSRSMPNDARQLKAEVKAGRVRTSPEGTRPALFRFLPEERHAHGPPRSHRNRRWQMRYQTSRPASCSLCSPPAAIWPSASSALSLAHLLVGAR